MSNRFLLAIFAMVVTFGCQTAYPQPPKPCSQLMREVMMEHAKEGSYPVGAQRDKDTGAEMVGYMNATLTIYILETLMPSGHPPPSKDCQDPRAATTFTLVDECMGSSPTGEQVTYKYWRCTGIVPGK